MSEITEWIRKAEQKWLKILFSYCRDLFRDVYLPSHDHHHHLRVWHFTRELLRKFCENNSNLTYQFVEGLMIAVFFHDTGMSVTYGVKHGTESTRICRNFFHENKIPPPPDFTEILDAIENHDEKEYGESAGRIKSLRYPSMNKLLNISDDLDAFGYTGIYRYAEIYLLRHIPAERLAGMVLKNLAGRFEHLSSSTTDLTNFMAHHYKRYEITRLFFDDLKKQTENIQPGELYGPIKVIRIIHEKIIVDRKHPADVIREIDQFEQDEYTLTFFRYFQEEETMYRNLFRRSGLL